MIERIPKVNLFNFQARNSCAKKSFNKISHGVKNSQMEGAILRLSFENACARARECVLAHSIKIAFVLAEGWIDASIVSLNVLRSSGLVSVVVAFRCV